MVYGALAAERNPALAVHVGAVLIAAAGLLAADYLAAHLLTVEGQEAAQAHTVAARI